MKRLLFLAAGLSLLLGFDSCKKDTPVTNTQIQEVEQMRDMKAIASFDWLSYDRPTMTINIQSPMNLDQQPIYLYDEDFKLIQTSVIQGTKAMFSAIIPSRNAFATVFIPANRASLEIKDFNLGTYNMVAGGSKIKSSVDTISPSCSSNCDNSITSSVYSLTVAKNNTTCLTGSISGSVTMKKKSTLIICGAANITSLSIQGSGCKIYISDLGSLQLAGMSLNSSVEVYNYSNTCNINGTLNLNTKLYNFGSMTINALAINSGEIRNYGSITVVNNTAINNNLKNYGSFTVGGTLTINNDGVENYCKIICNQSITISKDVQNDGYIKALYNFTLNNHKVEMGAASMISCQNITLNGEIEGGASACAVKVSGTTTINNNGKVTGLVNFCDANGIETNYGTIASSVVYCVGYLPINSCNPEGIGAPAITDSDNDGVADDVDDYPNNANLAYNNISPYSGYKTIAFEDLWPSMGDFDFNDVMIKTQTLYKSNANNKVVSADVTVVLSALGAGNHNGIGLQFVTSSNTQITGFINAVNGASIGTTDANCIIVTNDVFSSQSTYYTNTSASLSGVPDTLNFSITFNTSGGIEFSNIVEDFFIFRSNERGLEIHAPNRPPTSAATSSYFGTFDDNSDATQARYYKTANNLPWAIEVVDGTGIFRNPLEKIQIIDAYPQFQQWATSSGSSYTNWFGSPNPIKIFQMTQ